MKSSLTSFLQLDVPVRAQLSVKMQKAGEERTRQTWASLNHCTALPMDIELAETFSLIIYILCFTEGIFLNGSLKVSPV